MLQWPVLREENHASIYEAFSLAGVGHAVPFDGDAVATYFGLGDAEGPDPEAAACPDTSAPGSDANGPGGASGSGGAASSDVDTSGGAPVGGADGTLGTISPPSDGEATAAGAPSPATPSVEANEGETPATPVTGGDDQPEPPGLKPNETVSSGGCTSRVDASRVNPGSDAGVIALLAVAAGLTRRRARRATLTRHVTRVTRPS